MAYYLVTGGAGVIGANIVYAETFTEPVGPPPENNTSAPLNVSSDGQTKIGGLILNTGGAVNGLIVALGNVGIGDLTPDTGTGGPLKVDVEGNVGATKFCDALGNNCYTTTEMVEGGGGGTFTVKTSSTDTTAGFLMSELVAGSGITLTETGTGDKKVTIASTGGGSGVSRIIAGTGITVSPTGGTGDVTISLGGTGERVVKSGTVTLSSWTRYSDPYAGWYRSCSTISGSFPSSYQVLLSSNGVVRDGSTMWRNKTQTSFDVCAVTDRAGAYRIFDGTDTG